MKFNDYVYTRPDMDRLAVEFKDQLKAFNLADSVSAQIEVITCINKLRNTFETMSALVRIRYTIDTTNEFYDKENDYIDEVTPIYEGLVDLFYQALDQSLFKSQLVERFGQHLFDIVTVKKKTFSPDIVDDLKRENQLASQYTKLRTSAKIPFEGKILNLAQMVPYYESKDRIIREASQKAVTQFFEENESAFDQIYDDLVKVRHTIATKLGFENFVPLGYLRLSRTDYGANEVASYRRQVLRDIVPLATSLRHRQRVRLGKDNLYYFDEPLAFNTGNATPKGDSAWILEKGSDMYSELSAETSEFFQFMQDRELLDLEAKEGKAGGGYCSFIADYKSPFIFSNFNGTSGDIDVLTHEAGHAFQVYQSRNYDLPEYVWPTLEACEIHSMSMEFFTWPWMKNFFLEDELKYKFNHLSEALLFIPYGVLVDEFQHFVYEHPYASTDERKMKWRELERQYLPYRNYKDNDFLERGGYWFRQGHIFSDPFYYIDYTLAQVCAFQFFVKSAKDQKTAWQDYLNLCNKGGSLAFQDLLKIAKLDSPFDEGSLKKVVPELTEWLEGIDDSKL